MAGIQIVTDSAAELSREAAEELGILVVPWSVQVDGESMPDSPQLSVPDLYRRAARARSTIEVLPPTAAQFATVLDRCSRSGGEVVAVLSASRITRAVDIARKVRAEFMGRCDVHIVDTQFISCVQGELAAEAARGAQVGMDAVEIVRHLNGMIARSYLAFAVDSGEQLVRHSLIENSPSVLGSATGYRPLLLLEEGAIVPLPRSRRRGEQIDRMAEFVGEFTHLQRLWTVSSGVGGGREALRERLQEQLPERPFADHTYGPVVASYFGPTLLGVAAIETA